MSALRPSRSATAAAVDEFCVCLTALAVDLAGRFPDDATIALARKRIVLATRALPVSVVEVAGPHIFKHREAIYAGDTDHFFAMSFEEDLAAAKNPERRDLVAYIIPRAKEAARAFTPDEKGQYLEWVRRLLDSYVDFLLAKKGAASPPS